MRISWLVGLGLTSIVGSLAACSGPADSLGPSRHAKTSVTRQGIVGGNLDSSASNATVAVTLTQEGDGRIFGACTGALVKIDQAQDVAYVLTAAHCVTDGIEPVDIRVGTDWSNPSLTMPVASTAVHPDYTVGDTGQGYDFAVIAVRNLPAGLPTPYSIPGASDGLSNGSSVTIKGYGNTISYGNPDGQTTQRKTIGLTVLDEDAISLTYDQQNGGPCDGDSGGPAIAGNVVVGVTSYGYSHDGQTDSCSSRGVSARVTSGRVFIQAILNGEPPPPPDACKVCRSQAESSAVCQAKYSACENSADCIDLYQCLATQGADQQQCLAQHPNGQGPLFDALDCACADVCVTECSGKPACQGTQKCGLGFGATSSYGKCIEEKCCDELDDAAANGLAFRCLTEDTPPSGCTSNSALKAYQECADAQCGGASSSSGGSSSGSSGASGSSGSSGSDGDDDSDDDSGDDDAEEEPTTEAKTGKKKDEGGCSTTPGGASGAESAIVLGGLAWVLVRRRRGAR